MENVSIIPWELNATYYMYISVGEPLASLKGDSRFCSRWGRVIIPTSDSRRNTGVAYILRVFSWRAVIHPSSNHARQYLTFVPIYNALNRSATEPGIASLFIIISHYYLLVYSSYSAIIDLTAQQHSDLHCILYIISSKQEL